ncbi:MAG: ABC transporter ATP-binding protein [Hyphomicrobiales bacterium]|nr:ABC transporter ATP-binding protein [Hyphomicrobiales bacterium]
MASVLDVRDLTVRFDTADGEVCAVDGLDFSLEAHETLAVVGESGAGKSQIFLAILGLLTRNGRASGTAAFGDHDLIGLDRAALDDIRGRDISIVFQDPMTSMNPSLTIARQMTEVLERHQGMGRIQARAHAIGMLEQVGIADAPARFDTYPYELSGGMRQRVIIAMALLCNPRILIADEPTTSLDVTLQAQILALFHDLKQAFGSAVVVITHDLGVVATLAQRVMVMYAGYAVEISPVDDLFDTPQHPYTRALLNAMPRVDREQSTLVPITGQPPNLERLPPGCPFHPRCPQAFERCRIERPPLETRGVRSKACFLDWTAAPVATGQAVP